jgi:hypothetical protein
MAIDFAMPALAVEDSATTGNIVSGLLHQLGFQKGDVAQGGITALTKMGERGYGLVVHRNPPSSLWVRNFTHRIRVIIVPGGRLAASCCPPPVAGCCRAQLIDQ